MFLPRMFNVWRWYTTLYLAAVFSLWQLWAVASAAQPLVVLRAEDIDAFVTAVTSELNRGTGLGELLTNPAVLTSLFALIGGLFTLLLTDAAKLSTTIKGSQTQIMAWFFAAATAGAGGYFGASEVAGLSGWGGALVGVLSTLGAGGLAIGAHERRRYAETGMRKPERQAAKTDAIDTTVVLAGEGLKLFAKSVGVPAFVVDTLISERGLEEAERLIRSMQKTRASTVEEAGEHVQGSQAERAAAVRVAPGGGQ